MKLDLSGLALDTITLALQAHQLVINSTLMELQDQVRAAQEQESDQKELPLA